MDASPGGEPPAPVAASGESFLTCQKLATYVAPTTAFGLAAIAASLIGPGVARSAWMEAISPLTDFSFDFHDLRLMPTE